MSCQTIYKRDNVRQCTTNDLHNVTKHNIHGTEIKNYKIIQYPQAQNLANTHWHG